MAQLVDKSLGESKTKKKAKKNLLSRELAEEKARNALLLDELEKSRMQNAELLAGLNVSSAANINPVDNAAIDFDYGNRLCSTQHVPTPPSLDESRFLSSMNQLSVASINVPECKPIDDDDDIHRQSFESWKDLLIDCMKLAGIDDEFTKFTVFKVKAGARLLELFRNTKSQADDPDPDIKPFSNAMHRLKSYFGSGSDVMLMRRKLALMSQKPIESDLTFITRVGSTARLCEFDETKEFEEIVATVAEHARNRDVRTAALKMLSRKGCFTDLVDKVREIEAIRLNEEFVMRKHGKNEQTQVAYVTDSRQVNRRRFPEPYEMRRHNYRSAPMSRDRRSPQGRWVNRNSGSIRPSRAMKCWRCNSVFHTADVCNARDKTCNNCGRMGHIRRACRAQESIPTPKRTSDDQLESIPKIAAIEKEETNHEVEENVSEVLIN
ncbi:uncharacterized protein LOC131689479 [Topomyia yanbarensis]|uniref:uncharacterized protein LOC131689479 n=1 Tax=Topomyia yanbarensis TaxID=2498891 RepID=UPI00273CDAE3|nr:uncharacterized protein LOC131689479 [Topomyia yanbarensis]